MGVFLSIEAWAISANCSVGLTTFNGRLLVLTAALFRPPRLSNTIFDLVDHGDDLPTELLKWSTHGWLLMAVADLYALSIAV